MRHQIDRLSPAHSLLEDKKMEKGKMPSCSGFSDCVCEMVEAVNTEYGSQASLANLVLGKP